jgi:hypothetical protein
VLKRVSSIQSANDSLKRMADGEQTVTAKSEEERYRACGHIRRQ